VQKEVRVRLNKLRLYVAGVLAVLLGIPLTEKAFGATGDIVSASFDLAGAIANLSGGKS
jgi:hypothetical protein